MTFEQLAYFVEVYRQKSITNAADNLYVSRQALSSIIRKLEKELNVELFYRLPDGVEPTLAAIDLFTSAKIILEEKAVLNQKMKYHSGENKSQKKCCVSMPEALMATCGNLLLEALTDVFPRIWFSFSSIQAKDIAASYQDFDIVIFFVAAKKLPQLNETLCDDYTYRILQDVPMYIWCANTSRLNGYKEITFEILKQYPYCTYKNLFDYSLFTESIYENKNLNPVISIEKIFSSNIQHYDYYTSDCCLNHGEPFYKALFKDKPFALRQINERFCLTLMYKKSFADYCTIIDDYLMKYYFKE